MGKSYGFFEIPSTTAAIEAVDIMCKTADVEFVTWEKKLGGRLVTVIIEGSVAAVQQAIDTAAVNGIKEPVAYTVIANPHEEVRKLVELSAGRIEQ
jgi:Carbon dioxide concentrating mechanism/carboxysome shell protein